MAVKGAHRRAMTEVESAYRGDIDEDGRVMNVR